MGIGVDFSNISQGNGLVTAPGIFNFSPATGPITTTDTNSLPPNYTPSGYVPQAGQPNAVTPPTSSTVGGILQAIGGVLNPTSNNPVPSSGAPAISTVSAPVAAASPLSSPIVWLGALVILGAGAYLLLAKKKR
jgi:hypothetical protein